MVFNSVLQCSYYLVDILSYRCNSTDKVKVVKVVAKEIAKLSARLVDCATEMSKAFQMEEGEEPPLAVREEAELLRREWSSQVNISLRLMSAIIY